MDVVLRHGNTEVSMPLIDATDGPSGFVTGRLLSETGLVSYNPGFVNTGACSSAITSMGGDAGVLRYRGYPFEQLAEQSTFLGTSSSSTVMRCGRSSNGRR